MPSFETGASAEQERGPSIAKMRAEALGVPETAKETALKGPSERYLHVQKRIIELESNLQRSVNDAIAARKDNPARAELLTAIGKAITEDIEKQQIEKAKYEKEIRDVGGDPSDYTVQ